MSLWAVLLTGLFAGGASCAAVQGGLLAGVLARRQPVAATSGPVKARSTNAAAPVAAIVAAIAHAGYMADLVAD